jgi:hypothetical protein
MLLHLQDCEPQLLSGQEISLPIPNNPAPGKTHSHVVNLQGNGTRLLIPCKAPNPSIQEMHRFAGGKLKRAIFAGNAPERTLDRTSNGV